MEKAAGFRVETGDRVLEEQAGMPVSRV